jgi:signal transduction histidine kinase
MECVEADYGFAWSIRLESCMNWSLIRLRLPLSYALIALLAAMVLGSILLLTLQSYYTEQEYNYLKNNAQLISPGIGKILESDKSSAYLQVYIQNLSFLIQARVRLLDVDGNVVADSGSMRTQHWIFTSLTPDGMNAEVLYEGKTTRNLYTVNIQVVDNRLIGEKEGANSIWLSQLPTENTVCGFGLSDDPKSLQHSEQAVSVVVSSSNGNPLGTLEISEGMSFGGQIVRNVARTWVFASMIAVVVAAIVGLMVSRRLILPLNVLTDATQQMASGDLSARAHIESKDEFRVLGCAFNNMAERVEEIVATLSSFVSDAAHELHTPLTTLKANLELALDDTQFADQHIFRAQQQVVRMQDMIDNLLRLSQIEASDIDYRRVSLSNIVQQVAEVYSSRADHKSITFSMSPFHENVFVLGDSMQIRQVIENLLDNAIKFTPVDGSVYIQLVEVDKKVRIIVEDSGIGIPKEDMSQLFKRFHRGRNASSFPGSGLGLAIVKSIIDSHGGEIEVQSDVKGTCITVLLPLSE